MAVEVSQGFGRWAVPLFKRLYGALAAVIIGEGERAGQEFAQGLFKCRYFTRLQAIPESLRQYKPAVTVYGKAGQAYGYAVK
jgi:hypothetical protein